MNFLVKNILFFSFFTCLAIFNIPSVTWGLQLSWFLGLIFSILMTLIILLKSKIVVTKKFKYFLFFIFYFIISTLFSLVLININIINLNEDFITSDLTNRSITHFIYLIFNFLVAINIYIYFQKTQKFDYVLKYFIAYPSIIIIIIGIYGFLATFNLVPVDTFLHNNLSLGYTFERFKHAHRTASIFAEPSHYGTYLAFLLPIYYAYLKKKIKIFSYSFRIPILILYISQIIMIQSMSFYLVFPLLLIISYYSINDKKFNLKSLIYIIPSILSLILIVLIFVFSRINDLINGEDGSFIIRFGEFIKSIELFISSPIIGVGYGAIRGIDSLSTLLATIGLLGIFVFIYFIKKIYIKLNYLQKLLYLGFVSMFITSLVADGITDFLHFWIIISILLVVDYKEKFKRI